MTPEQLNAEVAWYSYICREQFTEDWQTITSIDTYSDRQKDIVAAEIAYYYERGKLPSWASIIQCVERVDDAHIFVHADIDARM